MVSDYLFFEPVPIIMEKHTVRGDVDIAMSDEPYGDCGKSTYIRNNWA